VVEIVILILWTTSTTYRTRLSIASAVVRFVTAVAICSLSHYEQTRTLRPSPVINFYLLFSAFFDAVQVRTFWLADANGIRRVAITSSVAIGLKFALLILEAIPKPTFVISRVPPEEVAGIYSLRTFWWLNKLFRQGYSRSLHQNDLYGIHNQLKASYCGPCIIAKWYSGKLLTLSRFHAFADHFQLTLKARMRFCFHY
jgi:ATP-binding cassette subfamily C (CFTR/MRP) protein 1